MRVEQQPGFILHTRPFRETSLLVDTLTPDYGRLTLIAKGGRNPKNHQQYLLQPFIALRLSWQGKSDLKTLIDIEAEGETLQLRRHYLYSGLYANELLTYLLLQGDPHEDIFILYQQLLQNLAGQKDLELCLRYFEFSLLNQLGYGIDFTTEANTNETIAAGKIYKFVSDLGFSYATKINTNDPLQELKGEDLLAIAKGQLVAPELRLLAKQISRRAIQSRLNGKHLKSRELFKF